MKTRPKAKTRIRKAGASGGAGDAATLSVRLTTEERKLLADAASLRGWTPTNLLRVAALERAAQILNTSTPRKVPFARLAEQTATVLCGPRGIEMRWDFEEPFQPQDLRGTLESLGAEVSDGFDYRFTPSPISGVEVQSLQEAVRLGGPDFLTQVIAECVRLLAPDSAAQQLPDAIDPNSFS